MLHYVPLTSAAACKNASIHAPAAATSGCAVRTIRLLGLDRDLRGHVAEKSKKTIKKEYSLDHMMDPSIVLYSSKVESLVQRC